MSRVGYLAPVLVASMLAACTGPDETVAYSPSLTQLRIGEVVVADPPVIPEDFYIPGIVTAPEDFEYAEEGRLEYVLDLTYFEKLDDPTPLDEHTTMTYAAGTGALLDETKERALTYDDVQQGAIGDCYFAAALTSALYNDVNMDMREGLIREVSDKNGHVTKFVVRFYDAYGKPQDISIDADIVRKNGKSLYMRSADSATNLEEWAPTLVEKAYAKWHGGYEKIGNGGFAGDVLQALTGSTASYRDVKSLSQSTIYTSIDSNIKANKPVVSCTYGEEDGVDYTGTGVHAWHCYSVHGVKTVDSVQYVTLRNPWGYDEPANNGANDGIFDLSMADYARLYEGLWLGGGYKVDKTAPSKVSTIAVPEVGDGKLTVTWKATGDDGSTGMASEYDVRVSTSTITSTNFYSATRVSAPDPAAPGTQERLEITGLTNGTKYYVALKVLDEGGLASSVSNVGSGTPVSSASTAWATLAYNFDTDAGGFTYTGLWHRSSMDSSSGSYSFYFGSDDTLNYSTGSAVAGELTSPVITAPGTAPKLAWKQVLDVETDAAYDQAYVQVATESGGYADWTTIWTKGSMSQSFTTQEVLLSGYVGKKIKIRFAFDSGDEVNNETWGWFVDDVTIFDSASK